jgi:hypothetical protein
MFCIFNHDGWMCTAISCKIYWLLQISSNLTHEESPEMHSFYDESQFKRKTKKRLLKQESLWEQSPFTLPVQKTIFVHAKLGQTQKRTQEYWGRKKVSGLEKHEKKNLFQVDQENRGELKSIAIWNQTRTSKQTQADFFCCKKIICNKICLRRKCSPPVLSLSHSYV